MTTSENRNYAFAGALVEELARSGLRHACICPGSRSTPVAISFARQSQIKKWLHLDERSASFFALGMAQALEMPVAVVCTSGTAAANFFPAVIEARYAAVPLIVITTDRPPELWEWGAPQTMDQTRLFGLHAKWSVAMPPPEATPELLRYVRMLASRVVATSLASPAGPVHVNIPFREPLTPEEVPDDLQLAAAQQAPELWQGRRDHQPFTQVMPGALSLDDDTVERLAAQLQREERGIIVCGPQRSASFPALATAVASRLGFPLLSDPLSQVRAGHHDREPVVDNYDLFLRDPRLADTLSPEVVVRFGAAPTSKPLTTYLERHRQARHLLVAADGWSDPSHLSTDMVQADPGLFCEALLKELRRGLVSTSLKPAMGTPSAVGRGPGEPSSTAWLQRWLTVCSLAREATDTQLQEMEELFEGKVFSELAALLPDGAAIFAGNSMPVRDMDTFFPCIGKSVRCLSNRGVNGIDGVVSSALGFSSEWPGRLVLVLGDLSFYHDMNGLLAARRYGLNATIIVVNNDGGGIFSFLPQAAYPEVFEEYFGTPTAWSSVPPRSCTACPIRKWPRGRSSARPSPPASRPAGPPSWRCRGTDGGTWSCTARCRRRCWRG